MLVARYLDIIYCIDNNTTVALKWAEGIPPPVTVFFSRAGCEPVVTTYYIAWLAADLYPISRSGAVLAHRVYIKPEFPGPPNLMEILFIRDAFAKPLIIRP